MADFLNTTILQFFFIWATGVDQTPPDLLELVANRLSSLCTESSRPVRFDCTFYHAVTGRIQSGGEVGKY